MIQAEAQAVAHAVSQHGFAHVGSSLCLDGFRDLGGGLGFIVAEEQIAIRGGAHAYVAKPGRVPFHTDQAQVEVIGWLCQEQDDHDGASLLVDSQEILARLDETTRDALRRIRLACPPVVGGPPTIAVPVLRRVGDRDLFFCSPWLDPVGGKESDRAVLRQLWAAVEGTEPISIRLGAGEALFVDNQRIMHGRSSLSQQSRRRLHRLWIIGHATAEAE